MARIRTVKPEFWTDGDVMDLSPQARLLFIGSWNFSMCDYGHLADDPRRLRRQVLPEDEVMMVRVDGEWTILPMDPVFLVDEILSSGRMVRIEVAGRSYLHIVRFTDHQRLEKRWTPRCVACKGLGKPLDTTENLSKPRETSREFVRTRGTSASDRTGQDGTTAAAAAGDAAAAALDPTIAVLADKLRAHTPLRGLRFDTLKPDQVDRLRGLIETHGDEPLVQVAINTCRSPAPTHASAFLGTWDSLPPPGRPLHVVRPRYCDTHNTKLTPAGVCSSCASDQKAGNR